MNIHSIYQLTSVTLLFVTGYMLLIHLSTPGIRGMRWVLSAYLSGAAALWVVAIHDRMPPAFALVLITVLLACWNYFLYLGISAMLDTPPTAPLRVIVLELSVLLLASVFARPEDQQLARILLFSGISILQYGFLATLLLRYGTRRTRMPRIGMAALFLLWCAAHVARAVYAAGLRPQTVLTSTNATETLAVFVPAFIGIMTCLGFIWMAMARLQGELEQQSQTDSLTGLLNRRALDRLAEREIARSSRTNSPLALLICDLDHFKAINDRFGHTGGDAALCAAAECILHSLRTHDIVARLGGEEFIVLLPGTSAAGAFTVAERIRTHIAELPIEHRGRQIQLTGSLGIGMLEGSDHDWEDILHRADKALYQAKSAGRNRTEAFHPSLHTEGAVTETAQSRQFKAS